MQSLSGRFAPRAEEQVVKAIADADTIKNAYEVVEHTADIGIRVWAGTLEELFAMAACAMFDLMVDIANVQPTQKAEIGLEAENIEELLVTWLNELAFRAEVSGMFFSRFEVESVTETSLRATALGEPFDEEKHSVGETVKAATYHKLEVSKSETGWFATVIFDV